MRKLLAALGVIVVAGCTTTPQLSGADKDLIKPPELSVAQGQRERVRLDARNASREVLAATPAGFSLFCDCDEELEETLEDHEFELALKNAEINALKERTEQLLRPDLVRFEFVKFALYRLGYYRDGPGDDKGNVLSGKSHQDILGFDTMNPETITAAKRFQWGYHAGQFDPSNPRPVTGWLTVAEARDAVCRNGRKANDETAIKLAQWLNSGTAYKKQPILARSILIRLRDHLKGKNATPLGSTRGKDAEISRLRAEYQIRDMLDQQWDLTDKELDVRANILVDLEIETNFDTARQKLEELAESKTSNDIKCPRAPYEKERTIKEDNAAEAGNDQTDSQDGVN